MEVEEIDSLTMYSKVIDLRMLIKMVVSMEIMTKEMAKVLLEIEDKAGEILEVHCMVKVENMVDLTKVQM